MKEKERSLINKTERADSVSEKLNRSLEKCELCRHLCGANRTAGRQGKCGCGRSDMRVHFYGPHLGEEPPFSGTRGSGTIFFSPCNLECVYCQNHKFSRSRSGQIVSPAELADIMIGLQTGRCHNINLVSPTPFVPHIVEALKIAYQRGLSIPIVYNTGGYDSPGTIALLDGIVNIYLPDMRYASDDMAVKYSSAPGYTENNKQIIKEMFRQTGHLEVASNGIAVKGLAIRLLVLPGGISGTEHTLEHISREMGKRTFISLMSQYYPAYMAPKFKELSKRVEKEEYERIAGRMEALGFINGWIQPFTGTFDPGFAGENF